MESGDRGACKLADPLHFSHIRENILSWLPFTGEENVLEIGSDAVQLPGALCKKAKQVTCIELSRKRSHINAWETPEL